MILLAALSAIIALGKVEQATILVCLLTLAGGYAQWAFGVFGRKEDTDGPK